MFIICWIFRTKWAKTNLQLLKSYEWYLNTIDCTSFQSLYIWLNELLPRWLIICKIYQMTNQLNLEEKIFTNTQGWKCIYTSVLVLKSHQHETWNYKDCLFYLSNSKAYSLYNNSFLWQFGISRSLKIITSMPSATADLETFWLWIS